MFVAIKSFSYPIFERIIKAGANKDVKNNDGYTPFQVATLMHQFEMAKYLITNGADITIHSHNSFLLANEVREQELAVIIKLKHPDLVPANCKKSKAQQVEAESTDPTMKHTKLVNSEMLRLIISNDDQKLREIIQESGMDKNELSTILIAAAVSNAAKSAAVLLELGADVNTQEQQFRKSSFHIAVSNEFTAMFDLLLSQKGVNPNLEDSALETPIFYAIRKNSSSMFLCPFTQLLA